MRETERAERTNKFNEGKLFFFYFTHEIDLLRDSGIQNKKQLYVRKFAIMAVYF